EANVVDAPEQRSEVGQLQLDSVVRVNLDDAGRRFLDAVGDNSLGAHALLVELVHLALQFRDDVALERIKRDRGEPEHRILYEHENDNRQQRPALKRGQGQRVTNKAAERFGFGRDHRDDLRRRGFMKMRQRKAQQPHVKLIAKTPQHPLAEPAFIGVYAVFKAAVDQHGHQKGAAQQHQIRNSFELDAENVLRKLGIDADRVVDDVLWQVERNVKKRKRGERKHQCD